MSINHSQRHIWQSAIGGKTHDDVCAIMHQKSLNCVCWDGKNKNYNAFFYNILYFYINWNNSQNTAIILKTHLIFGECPTAAFYLFLQRETSKVVQILKMRLTWGKWENHVYKIPPKTGKEMLITLSILVGFWWSFF